MLVLRLHAKKNYNKNSIEKNEHLTSHFRQLGYCIYAAKNMNYNSNIFHYGKILVYLTTTTTEYDKYPFFLQTYFFTKSFYIFAECIV